MAAISTTLAGPLGKNDQYVALVATTGVKLGALLLISQELCACLGEPTGNTVQIRRGLEGTTVVAHLAGEPVQIGKATDFAGPLPGKKVATPVAATKVYNATGPISNVPGQVMLVGSAPLAMTLPAPPKTAVGQLAITSTEPVAHTISVPSGLGGGATNAITFPAATTTVILQASNGQWVIITIGGASTGGDTTPPTVPTGLVATPNGAFRIDLTWTPSTDNVAVTGYLIEACQGAGCTTFAQVGTSATPNFSHLSLTPLATYRYQVRARDAANNLSGYSTIASATTGSSDTTPPTVTMTAPAPSAVVSGLVTVSATASDNVAVASVQFLLDGANLGAPVTTPPYQITWDSTGASGGAHTLSARATDTSNNSTTSSVVNVTVSNTYQITGALGALGAGATVSLTGAASASVTADVAGNYSFTALTNGVYTVTPTKAGYTFTPTSQSVTISGANQSANFTTSPAAGSFSISGSLTAAGSGATVTLIDTHTNNPTSVTTTADGSGNYSFTGLVSAKYMVTPGKAGKLFAPCAALVTISGANVTRNFADNTSATSPTGTAVSPGGLQTAINAATPGATLILANGTYNENITINKAINLYAQNMPATVNGRVASKTACFVTISGVADIAVDITSTAMVRLVGLKLTTTNFDTDVVRHQFVANHLVLDRCVIVGTGTSNGQRRGLEANGGDCMVSGCWFDDIYSTGFDSQCLAGWSGTNGLVVENSVLRGGTETAMFGGSDAGSDAMIPTTITFRNSVLTKDVTQISTQVKNTFELKCARWFHMTDCLLEHAGDSAGQSAYVFLFTVRNQDGGAPTSCIEDALVERCIGQIAGGGINFLGTDYEHPSGYQDRVTFRNVHFKKLSRHIPKGPWSGAGRGWIQTSAPRHLTLEQLTFEGLAGDLDNLALGVWDHSPNTNHAITNINYATYSNQYGWNISDTPPVNAWTGGNDTPPAHTHISEYMPDLTYAVTGSDGGATYGSSTYSLAGGLGASGSGATVTLSGATGVQNVPPSFPPATITATADGSGNYTFAALPEGCYTVTPTKSGVTFTPASQVIVVFTANVSGVNFSSSGAVAALSGNLGASGAGATVTIINSKTVKQTTTADGGGNYAFTTLANDTYAILPSKSGNLFAPCTALATYSGSPVVVNFTDNTTPGSIPAGYIDVAAGGGLQAAIDAAAAGSVLRLASGTFTTSTPIVINKALTLWAATMPTGSGASLTASAIISSSSQTTLQISSTALVRLVGIGVTNSGTMSSYLMAVDHLKGANHLVLDRCVILGNATQGLSRGLLLNGHDCCVTNCRVDNVFNTGFDGQCIISWDGGRDVVVDSCYLRGGSETIMLGAADPDVVGNTPNNFHFTNCTLTKDTSKYAAGCTLRQSVYLENCFNVHMDTCTCEYGGLGNAAMMGTDGAFLFGFHVKNENNTAPFSTIQNVLIENTIAQYGGGGVDLLGFDTVNTSVQMDYVTFKNVHFKQLSRSGVYGSYTGAGRAFQAGWIPKHITFTACTFETPDSDYPSLGYWIDPASGPPTGWTLSNINFSACPTTYGWTISGVGNETPPAHTILSGYMPDLVYAVGSSDAGATV